MTIDNTVNVVTVCYNAQDVIEKTVQSVLNQSYEKIRYVVIDGASSDNTLSIVEKYKEKIDILISEVDSGIYNAMNKALDLVEGGWIVFMNAGDTFLSSDTVHGVMCQQRTNPQVSLIYGDHCRNEKVIQAKPLKSLKFGVIMACHQAMFFKASSIRYDEGFKIYSDYDFVCQYIKSTKSVPLYIPKPLAFYQGSGVSDKVTWQKRKDKFRAVYKNFGIVGLFRSYTFKFFTMLQSYTKIFL